MPRPKGSLSVKPDDVIRRPVHLTIHRERHPLTTEWIKRWEGVEENGEGEEATAARRRGLAGAIVRFMERALAGGNISMEDEWGREEEEEFAIDMSEFTGMTGWGDED